MVMRNILITRPKTQNAELMKAVSQCGDNPIALPLLNITPIDVDAIQWEIESINQCLSGIAHIDCFIFISTNAVDGFFYWLEKNEVALPDGLPFLAIGAATQKRLERRGIIAQRSVGSASNSEALLQLPLLKNAKNKQIVIVRGQGGREHLKQQLENRGAEVTYLEVYKRSRIDYPVGTLSKLLYSKLDFTLLSSGETIQQLLHQAMMENISDEILSTPVIVPGTRLYQFAKDQGFTQVLQAENASVQAILHVIKGKG